jgi:glycosyltransferase involved in cell wall biosynthesis
MNIAFALGHELSFPPTRGGGVNSLLESLSRAFAAEGHSVTAYSPRFDSMRERETIEGVRHIRFKGSQRRSNNLVNAILGLPYALSLRAALEPCDVLSCHMLHSFLYASIRNARVVTHTVHRDPKPFLKLFRWLDRIYTGSDAVSEQARVVAPVLADKVRTVHNCVDFRGYELPMRNTAPDLRFIFVGRFSEDKGVDILIRAFVAAAKIERSISLSLVGPVEAKDGGDERLVGKFREYIDSQGLAERITIEPPIFDRLRLDERIRNSDVVCLSSVRGETLNMSIIESMRLAKCLLISDLPANAPLVRAGFNGLFARTGVESDWTSKILYLSANRDQVSEMGSNAYSHGQETFSSVRIARDYISDFNSLLEKVRRGGVDNGRN